LRLLEIPILDPDAESATAVYEVIRPIDASNKPVALHGIKIERG
jgi:hypothetical protein